MTAHTSALDASSLPATAVLDEAHRGDIRGALGTIAEGDHAPRIGWGARLKTLLAILGPGLIVMVGDNDAGAFGTYTQAGQNYGTALLWTLALLIPVLFVNQEMVLRLGAVTGVGHAREERLSRQMTPCSRSEPGRVWEIRRSRARLGGSTVDEDRPVMVLSQRGAADTSAGIGGLSDQRGASCQAQTRRSASSRRQTATT